MKSSSSPRPPSDARRRSTRRPRARGRSYDRADCTGTSTRRCPSAKPRARSHKDSGIAICRSGSGASFRCRRSPADWSRGCHRPSGNSARRSSPALGRTTRAWAAPGRAETTGHSTGHGCSPASADRRPTSSSPATTRSSWPDSHHLRTRRCSASCSSLPQRHDHRRRHDHRVHPPHPRVPVSEQGESRRCSSE